ncbi:MAG: carbonic anhydrase [Acidimicrobiales bacterium]|jgi:carbonic anhydrase|nr:carbonic anhydrase [Acidimicrobiales bacterium]
MGDHTTDDGRSSAGQSSAEQPDAMRLAAMPSRKTTIVTCMDARIDPLALVGFSLGDAHILRNAGGRVTEDVLRSLTLSTQVLGVRHVVIVHHTGCGLEGATNERLHAEIGELTGQDVHLDFHPIPDFETSLQEDVRAVLDCPLLPADLTVEAGVLDTVGGQVTWHRALAASRSA